MKVLHAVNTLSAGGAELHLLTLCRMLRRRGAEVVVAHGRERIRGSRSLRPDFERAGIRLVALGGERRNDWRVAPALARAIRRERPDVLHTHLPRIDIAAALLRPIARGVPWVASVHNIYRRAHFGPWARGSLLGAVWRRADAVIAISEAVGDWLLRACRVDPALLRVIHYGIELGPLLAVDADRRDHRIGAIGRLEPRKGHETLIRAMPAVRARVPDAELLIAGHDPNGYSPELRRAIAHAGVADCVRLLGFRDDVPAFLAGVDVFALATLSEGFGQVVIEAMGAGRPVVTSAVPPLTEIVEHGAQGLLVPPDEPAAFADAIASLLESPGRAARLGAAGRERVRRRFAADRMVDETLACYAHVLRGRRTA